MFYNSVDSISIYNSRSSGELPLELDGVNSFFPVIPVRGIETFMILYFQFIIVFQNDPETNPDNSPLGLIKTSLITVEKGHGYECVSLMYY